MPPARQGLAQHEQVSGAIALVLVIVSLPSCRLGRDRRPLFRQQLLGGLVETDHRALWVIGFRVKVQHILHTRHKLGAHLGNTPLLLLPRLETVFFNRLRIPSWDMEGASPNSTTLFARSRRVQWSWPGGASLHARAIRCASPLIQFGRMSWPRIFLQGPLQSSLQVPPLGTAHRTRRRVQRLHDAHHPQPVSAFSRIRARATFRAGLFPPRISRFQLVSFFLSNRTTYVLVPWLPPSYVNTPKKG